MLILFIFTLIIINGCENIVMDKTYCLADYDCACGNWKTGGCAVGNKAYIDTSKQCPDFCTGIAANLITKCIDNKCGLVQKENQKQCKLNSDCVLGVRLDMCCDCPKVYTKEQIEADKNSVIYQLGKDYSELISVDCKNVICEPCELISGVECIRNQCQKQGYGGQCTKDEDCVAATCCHPKACVHISQKPDCSGIMCTQVCEPGTLDCGQGKCVCDDGVCKAVIVELL